MTPMKKAEAIDDNLETQLFVVDEKIYGQNYKKHLLEQYKLCVEMADKISSRRSTANNFFLSVNTLLITAIGILSSLGSSFATFNLLWVIVTSLAGILFCWTWLVTIRSYKELNTAKFKIINEIEQRLPIAAFKVEWTFLTRENKTTKCPQLTKVERWVPKIFAFLYFVLMLIGLVSATYPWLITPAN